MLASRAVTIGFVVGILTSAAFAGEAGKPSAAAPLYPEAGRGQFVGNYCDGVGDVADLKLIDESFAFFARQSLSAEPDHALSARPGHVRGGRGWGAGGFRTAMDSPMPRRRSSRSRGSRRCNARGTSSGTTKATASAWASGVSLPKTIRFIRWWPLTVALAIAPPRTASLIEQGDGDVKIHDWFYEATAAGVVMQAEILLASRDRDAIARLPAENGTGLQLHRKDPRPQEPPLSCRAGLQSARPQLRRRRDSPTARSARDTWRTVGHLSGGVGSNGRIVQAHRAIARSWPSTKRRQKITRDSLPQLLAPAGYFVKSLEPSGVKHGVLGQARFGYLEGVANVDAVGLRVVDDAASQAIYRQIAAFPAIRPFDFLLTNAPGLDDTYVNYGRPSRWEDFSSSAIGSTAAVGAPSRAARSWPITGSASSTTSAARRPAR